MNNTETPTNETDSQLAEFIRSTGSEAGVVVSREFFQALTACLNLNPEAQERVITGLAPEAKQVMRFEV